MKFIDLFCGIGGFHQALSKLNHECILASDIDKKCKEVYKNNYGIEPIGDIKKINENEMDDFDILTSGFPCQTFSNSGKKKCFDDDRGLLFDEIIRIAKKKKPKFMFLENVKHILKVGDGKVIEYIKNKIEKAGYKWQIFQMSPHNYGIPANRERVYIVCVRNDIYNNKDIILDAHKLNLTAEDIKEENADSKYNIDGDVEAVLNAWDELIKQFDVGEKMSPCILIGDYFKNYTITELEKLPKWKKDYMEKNKRIINKYINIIKPWYNKHKTLLKKRVIYTQLDWQAGPLKANDSIYNHFIQIRQSGIRVKKATTFPTLVAINQTSIWGKYKRYITPREAARLQCFPDSFKLDESDKVSYKQLGNSVNVFNVYTVIKSTLEHYNLL
jgi:DNA (cytosine-5)-methyltransferase 1